MRRRWKRRFLWAVLLTGLAILAIPATLRQATAALTAHLRRRFIMRKLVLVLALVACVVVAGGGTFATASSTAESLTLVAIDLPKTEVFVDVGRKGDSPGDTTFFRETLRRNGKKAGGSEVMCVYVGGGFGRCQGTLRLPEGTLEAAGGTRFGGKFSLPVVGGTGAYAAARGVLTVTAVDRKRSRYAIELAG